MTNYKYPAYVQLDKNRYRERFGLDFEDFEVGQRFRHRPGYTFTQQDNINDTLDTQNQAMLHYDAHYASQTEFERPLMVTTIILQKLMGMSWKTFYRRKRILEWRETNMQAPVFAGDTLYAESEIVALEPECGDESCGLVTVRCRSFKPCGQQTCETLYDCLVYKRAHLPFEALEY
jgi:itaconyl-CoA hydratase